DARHLLVDLFDIAPRDGRITVEEVRTAELTRALLAPDVQPASTSFGIGITASAYRATSRARR
ncbi:MAG TPA: hypothetical protein VK427_11335, partial [Kofleriaceae bacterium]|nr:hypothetical protein [Kofleriaceae bacterium]